MALEKNTMALEFLKQPVFFSQTDCGILPTDWLSFFTLHFGKNRFFCHLSGFPLHPSPFPLHLSSFTLHLSPFTFHPSPFIFHPSPFTLHPSSFPLHPSPFTFHPSPFIFHLSPFILHLSPFILHLSLTDYQNEKGEGFTRLLQVSIAQAKKEYQR